MSATNRSWTVACLAGDGVGPELMAEASRALAAVARLHSLQLDDVHLPFRRRGADALRPPAAALDARGLPRRRRDPRLVAGRARARRRHGRPRPRLARLARAQPAARRPARRRAVGPGTGRARDRAAFELAAARRARLTSVGFTARVERAGRARGGRLGRPRGRAADARRRAHALPRPPGTVDLVVAPEPPRRRDRRRGRAPRGQPAHGRERRALADGARPLRGARRATTTRSAGFGVADPTGTLLAASLLLAEGLGSARPRARSSGPSTAAEQRQARATHAVSPTR